MELYTRLVLIFVVYSPTCRTSLHTSTHHTGNPFLGRVWHPESHSRCLDPNVRNPTILFPGTTDFILTILKGASIEAPWNSDFCLVCPKSWCKKNIWVYPRLPFLQQLRLHRRSWNICTCISSNAPGQRPQSHLPFVKAFTGDQRWQWTIPACLSMIIPLKLLGFWVRGFPSHWWHWRVTLIVGSISHYTPTIYPINHHLWLVISH